MRPFVSNGRAWRVVTVHPGDPRLIDREGKRTVGTTDPLTSTVHIAATLTPPMLDRVLLHEVAHAVTMSHGILPRLGDMVEDGDSIGVEEWAAQLVENHGIEAAVLASESLGRPLCIGGYCND